MEYTHLVYMSGIYHVSNKWVCSVPVTLLDRQGIHQAYTRHMTCLSSNVTGTEQTHLLETWYIPDIYTRCVYSMDIPGIYQVYEI